MDIINTLQAYKEEVAEIINSEKDYHKASDLSLMVDKIDNFIKDIMEFNEKLSA